MVVHLHRILDVICLQPQHQIECVTMEDILTMKVICPVKNQETFVMVHGWESKEGGRHIGVDKRKLY